MWHCGELLAQVAPQGGGDYRSSGRQRPKGRGAAATAAGLSERQRKTALRVHSIPRAEFNELIEAEPPATENQSAGSGPLIGQQRLAMPGQGGGIAKQSDAQTRGPAFICSGADIYSAVVGKIIPVNFDRRREKSRSPPSENKSLTELEWQPRGMATEGAEGACWGLRKKMRRKPPFFRNSHPELRFPHLTDPECIFLYNEINGPCCGASICRSGGGANCERSPPSFAASFARPGPPFFRIFRTPPFFRLFRTGQPGNNK